jgi:HEAT repeat protein
LTGNEAVVDDAAVVARLIELLGKRSRSISRPAADALAHAARRPAHRSAIEAALVDASPLRRWGAAFALARAGVRTSAVVAAALDALALLDGDIRWASAELLCSAPDEDGAIEAALRDACRNGSPEQRKMALYCLGNLGHRVAATYVAALDDESAGVRHAALSGLRRCGDADRGTLDRLLTLVALEPDAGVRRAAAVTLGRVMGTDEDAARALRRAADDAADRDFARAVEIALRGGPR